MKKKILFATLVATAVLMFTGCNYKITTNHDYNYAYINTGSTAVKVEVSEWSDYGYDMIEVVCTDGTVYLTSSENCVLIKK